MGYVKFLGAIVRLDEVVVGNDSNQPLAIVYGYGSPYALDQATAYMYEMVTGIQGTKHAAVLESMNAITGYWNV